MRCEGLQTVLTDLGSVASHNSRSDMRNTEQPELGTKFSTAHTTRTSDGVAL